MTRSLQSRLGLALALSLATIFIVQWLAVSAAIRYIAHEQIQTRLHHDAEMLLALLEIPQAGPPQFLFDTMSPIYHKPLSGHYYRVEVDGAVARSRSLWDEELPSLPDAGGTSEAPGPHDQLLLVLDQRYRKGGRSVRIAVAEDMTPLSREIRRMQYAYAAMSLLFFIALLALQVLLLRRSLAPLQRLRAEIRQLERGERDALGEDAPGEVVPLVRETNRLLAALTERLQRSRNATGNLAHAIKAPLTVLGQQAQRAELDAFPELRNGLRQKVDQIRELVTRELKRARIAGAAGAPAAIAALPRDIDDLIATLKAIYQEKALDIHVQLPADTRCPMDREDLLELLGNLIDNACKWAATTVALTITRDGEWRIGVEDDGPGADAAAYADLTRRGTRLDETAAGHGLGLAIVQDIVTAYHGRLALQRSERLGGFAAIAMLPLPAVSPDSATADNPR